MYRRNYGENGCKVHGGLLWFKNNFYPNVEKYIYDISKLKKINTNSMHVYLTGFIYYYFFL